MRERFATIPTDADLVELARATMQGQDVGETARRLGLHLAERTELYDSLAYVLRLVFDAVGGATGRHPELIAENVAALLASMPESEQQSRRIPLRLWN